MDQSLAYQKTNLNKVTLSRNDGIGGALGHVPNHFLKGQIKDPTTLLPALVLIDSGALLLLDSAALLLVHRAAAGPVIAHGVGGRDGRNPEVHEGVAEVCSITEPA